MRKYLLVLAVFLALFGSACAQTKQALTLAADITRLKPVCYLNMNEASGSLHDYAANLNYATGGAGAASILYRQQGYDLTNPNKFAVAFPSNAYARAPNSSACDFEWTQPFSVVVQVQNLAQDHVSFAATPIVSKGTAGCGSSFNQGCTTGHGWAIYSAWSGAVTTFCALVSATDSSGFANAINLCTTAANDHPNGYPYQIALTWNGTTSLTGMSLCVNASECVTPATTGRIGFAFFTVTGGTGYANSTAYTLSGGGPSCVGSGTMTSSGGVPVSLADNSHGCTSAPTVNLVSPTGTGAVFVGNVGTTSISSATTNPLSLGLDGASVGLLHPSAGKTTIDSAAVFNYVLPQADINSLWINSKWYQAFVGAPPLNPTPFVFSNDGCADNDNLWEKSSALKLSQLGYTKPVASINNTNWFWDDAAYKGLLDAYGFAHVPFGTPATNGAPTGHLCDNLTAFSGNIPAASTYMTDVQAAQKGLNALPAGKTAYWLEGGSYVSLQNVMQSDPAFFTSKVKAVYAQAGDDSTTTNTHGFGGNAASCKPCGAYVFANLASLAVPYYQRGAAAFGTGPGTAKTRTVNDPFTIALNGLGDVGRAGWDSIPLISISAPASMGIGAQGFLTISGDLSQETFTLNPSGTQFTQTFAYGVTSLYGWYINSLSGTTSQPSRRR